MGSRRGAFYRGCSPVARHPRREAMPKNATRRTWKDVAEKKAVAAKKRHERENLGHGYAR